MISELSQIRVIELSGGHASSCAGRVLAGFGAEVISLELLGSNSSASKDPQLTALRDYLGMGKQRHIVTADEVESYLSQADVLLTGDDLPTIRGWGLDLNQIKNSFPHLTITTVTPFGLEGPWAEKPATELTLQALSGLLAMSGSARREPLMRSLQQSKYATGLNAAYTSRCCLCRCRSR